MNILVIGGTSTSVYNPKHMNTVESDFNGYSNDFVWCNRFEFPYEEIKILKVQLMEVL